MSTPTKPKPGTRRYTVEYHSAGQPRPYADSIYDFTVTVEWIPCIGKNQTEWEPNDLSPNLIEAAAQALGESWYVGDKPEWHHKRLQSKTKVSPGVWRFVVNDPYKD